MPPSASGRSITVDHISHNIASGGELNPQGLVSGYLTPSERLQKLQCPECLVSFSLMSEKGFGKHL